MRIAYLINEYPKVSHSFVRREIHALERLGVEVRRFSVRPPSGALPEPADQREVELTHVLLDHKRSLAASTLSRALRAPGRFAAGLRGTLRASRRSDRSLVHHAAYLAEAAALLDATRREGCDHVHAHFGTNSATVAWLCYLLGGPPFSFTVHGPEEFDRADAIALTAKLLDAKFAVAISEFGRSQLLRKLPSDHWNKVKIVRCGLDEGVLNRDPSPVPDCARLCCIGRLSEQKGHLVLVEAARILRERGVAFELMLIGDGELRAQIESQLREYQLDPYVTITGYLSQAGVLDELSRCRALVLPSLAEGLPVVIMETYAMGRPVLSTYVAGIPELVEPHRSGWLVPAGSALDLANAMEEVLSSPRDALAEFARHGRARVRERHSVADSAAQLREFFSS